MYGTTRSLAFCCFTVDRVGLSGSGVTKLPFSSTLKDDPDPEDVNIARRLAKKLEKEKRKEGRRQKKEKKARRKKEKEEKKKG